MKKVFKITIEKDDGTKVLTIIGNQNPIMKEMKTYENKTFRRKLNELITKDQKKSTIFINPETSTKYIIKKVLYKRVESIDPQRTNKWGENIELKRRFAKLKKEKSKKRRMFIRPNSKNSWNPLLHVY